MSAGSMAVVVRCACVAAMLALMAPAAVEGPRDGSGNRLALRPIAGPALPPVAKPTPEVGPAFAPPVEVVPPGAPTPGLTLATLEQWALANNPSLAQARMRIAAAQGNWTQVGLPPNPNVGYAGFQINDQGGAGQQGVYLGQQFILGGKLGLNRQVASRDVQIAERAWLAQQGRVLCDVRMAFYDALVAERMEKLAAELERVGREALSATERLRASGEGSEVDVLQARIEARSAHVQWQAAGNRAAAARRRLAAVVGVAEIGWPLEGSLNDDAPPLEWQSSLDRIWAESPELAVAAAELQRARWALARAEAEPIPDLDVQYYPQHDNTSSDDIHSVQATMDIPLFDRNQGGIRQAQAGVAAARQELGRIRFDLQQRLAAAFERYATARQQAEAYGASARDAGDALRRVQSGFPEAFGYLTLLTAQRSFFTTSMAHLQAQRDYWQSRLEIEGLLLTGSLAPAGVAAAPSSPPSGMTGPTIRP